MQKSSISADPVSSPNRSRLMETASISKPFQLDNLMFAVDYDDNSLNVKWNLRGIPAEEAYSCRHILVADLSNETFAKEVICNYYKVLPLGDFLKVIDSSLSSTMPWIQRTSDNLNPEEIPLTEETGECSEKLTTEIMKLLTKFEEPTYVCFVLDDWDAVTPDCVIKLRSKAEKIPQQLFLSVLSTQDCSNPRVENKLTACCTHTSLCFSFSNIKKELKSLFALYAKLRVRRLDVSLECLEVQLQLQERNCQGTPQKSSTISKSFSFLNNYDDYSCNFLLYTTEYRQLYFKFTFFVELLNGKKIQASEVVVIHPKKIMEASRQFTEKLAAKPIPAPMTDQPAGYHRVTKSCEVNVIARDSTQGSQTTAKDM